MQCLKVFDSKRACEHTTRQNLMKVEKMPGRVQRHPCWRDRAGKTLFLTSCGGGFLKELMVA